MTTAPDPAAAQHARQVADAILYEGYLLYPYRATAQKNQERFQFGVLMPPGYAQVDPNEPAASQTECILEGKASAELTATVRFLQVQRRTVLAAPDFAEVSSLRAGGTEYTPWDEAAEREEQVTAQVSELLDGGVEVPFTVPGGVGEEDLAGPDGELAGRLVRRREALSAVIRLTADRLPGPYGALRIRLVLANRTEPAGTLARRADGLPFALIAAHSLICVPGGRFLSMTDPPEWAAPAVRECANTGTWPVLAGPAGCTELILSSPVILYDHPEIAAESAGQLYDSTEIDEILTLRTLTLTDAEKQEARATDPRAAELMDRLDHLPPEMLERMHGAIRYLRPASRAGAGADSGPGPDPSLPGQAPWWDPGADQSVSPQTDHVVIAGVRIARGSRVRMCPGRRRADAQDLFLAGRTALVEAVLSDVDGQVHLALIPDDDPAADLQRSHGRFLYFSPDEVTPIGAAS
ncbi:MAG TPA: hypothetical protein VMH35_00425 [Streptosporangiaceae bacterium]|nr:hypothetical protein [Streptosporangiaceae bacterium]